MYVIQKRNNYSSNSNKKNWKMATILKLAIKNIYIRIISIILDRDGKSGSIRYGILILVWNVYLSVDTILTINRDC